MDESQVKQFIPDLDPAEAGNYSPLVLAFLGDAVYELAIRTMLVKEGNARPNMLNRRKARLAKASAQSAMMEYIQPLLSDREADISRRGRNAKSYTMAKHASVEDYRRATGFEALMGYLYLTGEKERMLELIGEGIRGYERHGEEDGPSGTKT